MSIQSRFFYTEAYLCVGEAIRKDYFCHAYITKSEHCQIDVNITATEQVK